LRIVADTHHFLLANDGFHLVEQFRYALSCRSREFPQGTGPDDRQITTGS
jgi:hypothetical protein